MLDSVRRWSAGRPTTAIGMSTPLLGIEPFSMTAPL